MFIQVQDLLTTCPRWVLDPSLSALNSSNRGTYDYTKSRTVSPVNESFTVAYGGGLVTGRVIEETVTIGGLTFNNVSMGIANASSPYFLEQPSIGLLGLGPQPTYGMIAPVALWCFGSNSVAVIGR